MLTYFFSLLVTGRDHRTPHRPCNNAKRGHVTGYLKSRCSTDAGANDASIIVNFVRILLCSLVFFLDCCHHLLYHRCFEILLLPGGREDNFVMRIVVLSSPIFLLAASGLDYQLNYESGAVQKRSSDSQVRYFHGVDLAPDTMIDCPSSFELFPL
jgi:hypothetical protein